MSHQLFTELTPEQQEIVSGGIKLIDDIATDYSDSWLLLDATVVSHSAGSGVSQRFAVNKVKTSASKELIYFPTI